MSTLREKFAAGTMSIPPGTKLAKMLRAEGVSETVELRRILNLPRRDAVASEEFIANLTGALKTPQGAMTLKPLQAIALSEMHDYGGFLGNIRVGGGKTLISLLAPVVLEAQRPLLLTQGGLRTKTYREWPAYAQHWQIPGRSELPVVSYEQLGVESGMDLLDELRPTHLICDEVRKLKNLKASCTRRVARWMKEHPETVFVGMDGTLMSKTLFDFAHLAFWALKGHTPLPQKWNELMQWACAIDAVLPPGRARMAPGALESFMSPAEAREVDDTAAAQQAVSRRLAETPGFVVSHGTDTDASLSVAPIWASQLSPRVKKAFEGLRQRWEDPEGWEFATPLEVASCARQLALGYYYVWDPRPPPEWMDARKAWNAAVRFIHAKNERGLDSMLPIANAVRRGEWNGTHVVRDGMQLYADPVEVLYTTWKHVEPAFVPNPVARWLSLDMLDCLTSRAFLLENVIIWVSSVAVGEKLEEVWRIPYFGAKGMHGDDFIETTSERIICASIASNSGGRNLQRWTNGIVADVPSEGALWEQLLGRMHRQGQSADEVRYQVLLSCAEAHNAFLRARELSMFIQNVGGQEQKLCYADVLVEDELPQEQHLTGPEWAC